MGDIYKPVHLNDPQRKGRRMSITLYDLVDDWPDADALKEQILGQFTDERGAYKRTYSRRFDGFDDVLLTVIKERLPNPALVVHDIGASDARTSCDLFDKLLTLERPVEFYASDHCPEIRVITHWGIKAALNPEGYLTEIVVPPFVFGASRHNEKYSLMKRIFRHAALRMIAPPLVHWYKAGRCSKTRTIRLFGARARALAQADPRFRLLRHNVLDPSPIRPPVTITRAMNVLNASCFTKQQTMLAMTNIFNALEDGGLFVSGSNLEAGSQVDGGIYQKCGQRLETVWTSGKGHPFQGILTRLGHSQPLPMRNPDR